MKALTVKTSVKRKTALKRLLCGVVLLGMVGIGVILVREVFPIPEFVAWIFLLLSISGIVLSISGLIGLIALKSKESKFMMLIGFILFAVGVSLVLMEIKRGISGVYIIGFFPIPTIIANSIGALVGLLFFLAGLFSK